VNALTLRVEARPEPVWLDNAARPRKTRSTIRLDAARCPREHRGCMGIAYIRRRKVGDIHIRSPNARLVSIPAPPTCERSGARVGTLAFLLTLDGVVAKTADCWGSYSDA